MFEFSVKQAIIKSKPNVTLFDCYFRYSGNDWYVPINVPDSVPEGDRYETAKKNFKEFLVALAEEAAAF